MAAGTGHEQVMQYVWQHRLWPPGPLRLVSGEEVVVIDNGRLNTGPGPDFFNAKIKINGQEWVGNVEIHVRASDWHRHGHDHDPAYNSVILHVVDHSDSDIRRNGGKGSVIPQMLLPCTRALRDEVRSLLESNPRGMLPCFAQFKQISSLEMASWLDRMAVERISERVATIERWLELSAGDWEDAAYRVLARALGFGTNSDPMELLAARMPLWMLRRHASDSDLVEAMLFGRSGLLDEADERIPYVSRLKEDYRFMASKFDLKPTDRLMWRFTRNQQSWPCRRIAALAAIVMKLPSIASAMVDVESPEDVARVVNVDLSPFWQYRCLFSEDENHALSSRPFTMANIRLLTINAFVPFMVAWGRAHGNSEATDRGMEILQQLPPESNTKVDIFRAAGLTLDNALTTQALLCLRRNYCDRRKCLYCRIGYKMLSLKSCVV